MKILFLTSGFYPVKNATNLYEMNLYETISKTNEVDIFVVTDGQALRKGFIDNYDIKGSSIGKYNPDRFIGISFGKSGIFSKNYATDFSDELYDLINKSDYDFVLSSFFMLDKSRITSDAKLVYIEHDTMKGFVKETASSYVEKGLQRIREFELDTVKKNCDIVIAVSMMDLEYFSESCDYVRYLPTVIEPNLNQLRTERDIKYDAFYGGNATWFRTYMCTDELLRLTKKFDIKSYIYIPRLIAKHRVPYDTNSTVLDTSKNFEDEVHSQVKYSVIPHMYESGFPTKINIGLSNGLPILLKGDVTRYIPSYEADICKDIVIGYDTDEEFKSVIDSFNPDIKNKCIEFVQKYRSQEYVGKVFNKILEDYGK